MPMGLEGRWAAEGGDPERRPAALDVVRLLVAGPMSFAARPGTGGRRARLPQGFETDATRELLAELGEPQTDTYNGSN